VFYTILFGNQPFRGKSEAELFNKISKGIIEYPKSTHVDFRTLKKHNSEI